MFKNVEQIAERRENKEGAHDERDGELTESCLGGGPGQEVQRAEGVGVTADGKRECGEKPGADHNADKKRRGNAEKVNLLNRKKMEKPDEGDRSEEDAEKWEPR